MVNLRFYLESDVWHLFNMVQLNPSVINIELHCIVIESNKEATKRSNWPGLRCQWLDWIHFEFQPQPDSLEFPFSKRKIWFWLELILISYWKRKLISSVWNKGWQISTTKWNTTNLHIDRNIQPIIIWWLESKYWKITRGVCPTIRSHVRVSRHTCAAGQLLSYHSHEQKWQILCTWKSISIG